MKTKHFIMLLVITIIQTGICYSDVQLIEHLIRENVGGACAITAADFDLDGDIDLALTVSGSGSVIWMQNDGQQNFTDHVITGSFSGARSIYGIDLDLDGDTDLVATSVGLNKFAWFENNGRGVFTERFVADHWTGASWVIAGDVDLDGDNDIIGAACDMNQIGWFENDGHFSFTEHVIKTGWTKVNGCELSDIDQDGDMDIMATAKAGDILIFSNDGRQNFTEIPVCVNWGAPSAVRAGDLDADGDIDLVATSCGTGDRIAWFENVGGYRFVRHELKDKYDGARQCEIADIDQDGDPDILSMAWVSGVVTLFENRGPGLFREYEFCQDAYDMLKLYVVDIDGDSDLDVAGACFGDGEIRWWENVDEFMSAGISCENLSGHGPLEASFMDNSSARPGITSWEWDFNGDGVTDAFEQNPVFEFHEPGYYPVSLTIQNAKTSQTLTVEDYIRVFDGNSALEFDGSASYLDISPSTTTSLAEQFSFECWIKPFSFGEGKAGHIWQKDRIKLFVYESGSLLPNEACFALFMTHADGTISKVCSPSHTVTMNEWQHLSVTYDASKSLAAIYLNGLKQQLTQVTGPSGSLNDPGDKSMAVGNVDLRTRAFRGVIDAVRIWNRCLDQAEIQANLNLDPKGDEQGLIGSWMMDEGSGTTLLDPTGKNSTRMSAVRWAQGKAMNTSNSEWMKLPESLSITACPNPSEGGFVLKISGSKGKGLKIDVVDITGRIHHSINHPAGCPDNEMVIPWDGNNRFGTRLSPGLYFVRVSSQDEMMTHKILVK